MALRLRLSSIGTVWTLLALFVPFVFPASTPIIGDDIWWLLKSGEIIVETGQPLVSDPFNFSPHTPQLVNAQWLAEIVFYVPTRYVGLESVPFITAMATTIAFGLVLYLAWKRAGDIRVAAWCTMLATAVGFPAFLPRAQTLGLPLFMATYTLLTVGASNAKNVLLLAGTTALWANLHGSFLLAVGLTVLVLVGETAEVALARGWPGVRRNARVRFLCAAGAAQSLATLATPHGVDIFRYVLQVSGHGTVRSIIAEWWPTSIQGLTGTLFFAAVMTLLVVMKHSERPLRTVDLLLLLAFTFLALQAVRNVVWWGLIIAPILAEQTAHVPLWRRAAGGQRNAIPRRPALNAAILALLFLTAACPLPWTKTSNVLLPPDKRGTIDTELPEATASFLLSQSLPPVSSTIRDGGAISTGVSGHAIRPWSTVGSRFTLLRCGRTTSPLAPGTPPGRSGSTRTTSISSSSASGRTRPH